MVDIENLEVLPRGMEHLDHIPVAEQLQQRLERQPVHQRIDQNRVGLAIAAKGQLDQTELRVIGPLAQKFRVYSDIGGLGSTRTKRGKIGRGRDDVHNSGRSLFLFCRHPIPRIAQTQRFA